MKRLALLFAIALGCGSSSTSAPPPVMVRMQFDRTSDFWNAPFPSDDLLRADGGVAIDGFPNPDNVTLVNQAKDLLRKDARGFSQSGGVFFALTGAIDPALLPTRAQTMQPDASVFVMSFNDGQDGAPPPKRYPVDVAFAADGGPFGAPNMLSIVPLQGIPLTPGRYVAVLTTKIAAPSPEMTAIAARTKPASMSDAAWQWYGAALDALAAQGVDAHAIAGMAVFRTDDATLALKEVVADMLARGAPSPVSPFVRGDTFDDYCVYSSTIAMPDYQAGDAPYDFGNGGGAWAWGADGKPQMQRTETAHLVVTVPRKASAGPWPTVVFIRTGGGGDRPLVDRGPQAVEGGPPITPGTGPALYFARAGWAGVSVDGPHGGLRNATGADEQFLMFNVFNAPALRDNVRESAAEIALLTHALDGLAIDTSDCPGAPAQTRFDTTRLALMGHSMGATIAPLALAAEPRFEAVVLSGAGASWISNVLYKKKPLEVRPAIELLLGYSRDRRPLTNGDPVLSLFQWAIEPADPLIYTRELRTRHVLMEQGIVDHYIMPPIADATSLSLGLDLAGDPLDQASAEVGMLEPLVPDLVYSGGKRVGFPVQGNANGGATTAIVVQHPEDGIEDGHEVVFQTEAPKHEYRCFLASLLTGVPRVPKGTTADAPCE